MSTSPKKIATVKAFEQGVLMAASVLVSLHDQPGMAADIVNEFGLREADCSKLDDFDKQNLRKIQGLKHGSIKLRGLYGKLTPAQINLLKEREGACSDTYKPFIALLDIGLVDALRPKPGRVSWYLTTAGELVLAERN